MNNIRITRFPFYLNLLLTCLILFSILLIPARAQAAFSHQKTELSKTTGTNKSKIKKAFGKKEKNAKKRHLERFRIDAWSFVFLCFGLGALLFILGLVLFAPALWIIGLCLFCLPIVVGLGIILFLIIAFGTYRGGLE